MIPLETCIWCPQLLSPVGLWMGIKSKHINMALFYFLRPNTKRRREEEKRYNIKGKLKRFEAEGHRNKAFFSLFLSKHSAICLREHTLSIYLWYNKCNIYFCETEGDIFRWHSQVWRRPFIGIMLDVFLFFFNQSFALRSHNHAFTQLSTIKCKSFALLFQTQILTHNPEMNEMQCRSMLLKRCSQLLNPWFWHCITPHLRHETAVFVK